VLELCHSAPWKKARRPPLLKLSPQDGADAQTTQQAGIDWGVQSKSAQMGGGLSFRTLSRARTAIRVAVCMGR